MSERELPLCCKWVHYRGFIKFFCRRSVGFFSRVFLVFLMKESKKSRRKQPGTLLAKSRSQPVNLPGAQPLMNPLTIWDLMMSETLPNFTYLTILGEFSNIACSYYLIFVIIITLIQRPQKLTNLVSWRSPRKHWLSIKVIGHNQGDNSKSLSKPHIIC